MLLLIFGIIKKKYRIHAIKAPKSLAYPEYSFDINDKKDLSYINDLVLNGVNFSLESRGNNENSKFSKMKKKSIESFDKFLRKLFPLCRSLTGEMNRKTLKNITRNSSFKN